jgi:hypothetical protein
MGLGAEADDEVVQVGDPLPLCIEDRLAEQLRQVGMLGDMNAGLEWSEHGACPGRAREQPTAALGRRDRMAA